MKFIGMLPFLLFLVSSASAQVHETHSVRNSRSLKSTQWETGNGRYDEKLNLSKNAPTDMMALIEDDDTGEKKKTEERSENEGKKDPARSEEHRLRIILGVSTFAILALGFIQGRKRILRRRKLDKMRPPRRERPVSEPAPVLHRTERPKPTPRASPRSPQGELRRTRTYWPYGDEEQTYDIRAPKNPAETIGDESVLTARPHSGVRKRRGWKYKDPSDS